MANQRKILRNITDMASASSICDKQLCVSLALKNGLLVAVPLNCNHGMHHNSM